VSTTIRASLAADRIHPMAAAAAPTPIIDVIARGAADNRGVSEMSLPIESFGRRNNISGCRRLKSDVRLSNGSLSHSTSFIEFRLQKSSGIGVETTDRLFRYAVIWNSINS